MPPTATKSAYLTNLVIRELWARARAALADADRVIIAGYSVPLEDHVAAGLLADTLAGRDVEIVIADLCPAHVADRLVALGIRVAADAPIFAGDECLPPLTAWWLDDQASAAVESLRALAADTGRSEWGDVGVGVRWGDGRAGRIERDDVEGGASVASLNVRTSGATDLVVAASEGALGAANDATRFLDLVGDGPGLRRVLVEVDGARFPVIDALEPPRTGPVPLTPSPPDAGGGPAPDRLSRSATPRARSARRRCSNCSAVVAPPPGGRVSLMSQRSRWPATVAAPG